MILPSALRVGLQSNAGWTDGLLLVGENSDEMERELAMAARYVAEARRIVARQRTRILKLKALGSITPDHEVTLQAFVGALSQLQSHAQGLAEAAKRFQRPRRMLS